MNFHKKLNKLIVLATALAVSSSLAINAQNVTYKYKKYIPAVNVVDSPVTPTDPGSGGNTPQYGALTLSSSSLSFPQIAEGASAQLTVIASNLTNKPITASNISVTGGFSVSYSCPSGQVPALVEPGQNCAIAITGVGSSLSAKSGTLSIAYQSGGSVAASIAMPRSPVPSLVEAGASQIVLAGGNGASIESGTVLLLNSGEEVANIQSITVQGGGFSASQNCLAANNGSLPSNTTCTVTVSGVGTTTSKSGNLVVTYNSNKSLTVPIYQEVAVNNEGGVLSSDTYSITFDAKDVDAQDTKTFVVTNTADWGVTVKSVSVPQNSGYITSIACPGGSQLPAILSKNQSCTITVGTTYLATAQSTTVTVGYNSTSMGVAVNTPAGLAPTADVNTGSIAFGYFNPNSTVNVTQNVTLTNNGTKSLAVSGASLVGANPNAYSLSNGCGASLAPAASCVVSVTALTSTVGDYSASISLQTSAGNKSISLSSSVQTLTASSTELVAGAASSYLTATTTAVAPSLAATTVAQLYNQSDSSLQASASSVSWNAGSRTLTASFNNVTPASGMYVVRFVNSTGQILAKANVSVYNPLTLRITDSTNTSLSSLDFGSISTATQKTIRLGNIPDAKGSISISSVSVTSGGPFTLTTVGNPQGGAVCSSLLSMTLPPGGTCDVTVPVSVATPGNYNSGYNITVVSNATASTPISGGASVSIPVKAIVQNTVDPNYSAVIALLDASGGTPVNLASGGSVSNSGVTVSTSPSVTGAKTLYFNGSSTLDVSSTQSLGAGDFTIEGWYYYISDTNGFYFSGLSGAPSLRSMQGVLTDFQNDNGADYRQSGALTRNGWTHIAYVRNSGVVNIFINGVLQSNMTVNNTVNYTAPFSVRLGGVSGYGYYVNAYYDQFRVTKGLARYTSNFTPSAVPYASSAPANGSVVMNIRDTSNAALSSVAFGTTSGGTTKTFRINNDSTSVYALNVTAISVSAGGPPFAISGVSNALGGATCTSASKLTIPAGGSCDVTVSVGTSAGTYTSGYNITITSNATNSSPVSGASSAVLPVTATVGTVDPYWANVSLLGSMETTAFVDSSPVPNTMVTSGGVTRSTSIVKFGTSSIGFDGGASTYYGISGTNPSAVNFSSGDFTMEFFAYQPTSSAAEFVMVGAANGLNDGRAFYVAVNNKNIVYYWYPTGANSSRQIISTSNGVFTAATWHHVAVTRQGTTMRLFVDGVLQGSSTANTGMTLPSGSVFQIGREAAYSGNGFVGYIDEIRVTKGVARYTSNFVVPTAAFPRN